MTAKLTGPPLAGGTFTPFPKKVQSLYFDGQATLVTVSTAGPQPPPAGSRSPGRGDAAGWRPVEEFAAEEGRLPGES